MGIDYTVHIGPYVECKNERIDIKKTRRACTNEKCKAHKDHVWEMKVNFCSVCGTKIGQVEFVEKGDKFFVDAEEIGEMLHDVRLNQKVKEYVQYWLPNHARPNKKSRDFNFDPKHDEDFVDEIQADTIAEDLKEFKEQYKDAIAKLVKEYGKDNVTVKWGVIFYSH